MRHRFVRQAIGFLLYVIVAACYSTSALFAQNPNDQDNYYGDHIKFIVDINATETNSIPVDENNLKAVVNEKKIKLSEAEKAQADAMAGKDVTAKNNAQKTTRAARKALQEATDALTHVEDGHPIVPIPAYTDMVVIGQDDNHLKVKLQLPNRGYHNDKLKQNVSYSILKEDVYNSGPARTGATFGVLIVPFKYQLKGNKDLTGTSTIGSYIGYRFESIDLLGLGSTLTPIAFGGASSISVHGTSETDSNVLGVSYGFGLISTLKHAFQVGAVIGWDHVGSSNNYQYNGKPWLAMEIGYAFLQ